MQMASKYVAPKLYADVITATTGTPLLPRDILTMQFSNRLLAFDLPDGRTLWPVTARNDVSQALDTITQTIGYTLVRRASGWVGEPYGGGGPTPGPSRPWWWNPPAASDFTLATSAGDPPLSLTDDDDVGLLISGVGTNAQSQAAYIEVPDPALDWQVTARLVVSISAANHIWCGLGCSDGNGRMELNELTTDNGAGYYRASRWTSFPDGGFQSNITTPIQMAPGSVFPYWTRITKTSLELRHEFSFDGKNWLIVANQPPLTYLLDLPDRVFLLFSRTTGFGQVQTAYCAHSTTSW